MGPWGVACHADPSYDLSLGNPFSNFDFSAFHVYVLGAVGIVVFDGNIVSITSGIGRFNHYHIGGGQNGSSYIGSKICTAIGFDSVAVIGNSALQVVTLGYRPKFYGCL